MRWRPCARDLRRPRKRRAAMSPKSNCCRSPNSFPATDVVTLSRLGCRAVGESREQEASAKVAEVARLLAASPRADGAGRALAHGGPHSAEQGSVGGPLGAHRSLGRQRAPGRPRSTGRWLRPWPRAVATDPLRVYVQVSLDGDASRGGVDIATAGAVDRYARRSTESKCLELVGLMALPPLGWDPDRGLRTAADRSTCGCSNRIRTRWDCPRACPTISKLPSNTVRRVCVSVPRYWAIDRYRHRE